MALFYLAHEDKKGTIEMENYEQMILWSLGVKRRVKKPSMWQDQFGLSTKLQLSNLRMENTLKDFNLLSEVRWL